MPFQLLYSTKTPKLRQAIAIRPDGQAIVGAIGNNTIATWEILTGNLMQTWELDNTLKEFQVFRDGQTAIAIESNDDVTIWDIPTQRVLGRFPCGHYRFNFQSLSRDRSKIVGKDYQRGLVKVWDVRTGNELHSFEMEPYVTCVAIDPTGKIVVAGSETYEGGDIKVWDIINRRELQSLHVFHFVPREYSPYLNGDTDEPKGVVAIWLSPDAQTLLCEIRNREIHVWDLVQGQRLRVLPSKIQSIGDFTADSQFISTDSGLLNWRTGEITPMRSGLSWMTRTMAISQDGRFWATTSDNGNPVVQDLITKETIFQFAGHTRQITALAIGPDGTTVITGSEDHTAKIWNLASGELRQTITTGTYYVNALAVTPASANLPPTLFTGSKEIGIWDLRSGRKINSLGTEELQLFKCLAISPDGRLLASGTYAYGIQIWDWQRGKLLHSFKQEPGAGRGSDMANLIFSNRHQCLIAATAGGTEIKFWNWLTGEPLPSPLLPHSAAWGSHIALSPDERLLAIVRTPKLEIWNLDTGELVHSLEVYRSPLGSIPLSTIAFSPDNRLLVSGYYKRSHSGFDHNIKIWDVVSGREQQQLSGHPLTVTGLAFTSDGQKLVSCGEEASIRVWQNIGN